MGRKSQQRTTILIAAVVAGVLVCLAVGTLGVAVVLYATKHPAKKVYERDELRAAVVGKTQAEVIRLIGKPVSTDDTGGNASWLYEGVSYDKVNGRTDGIIFVYFRDGRVSEVRF